MSAGARNRLMTLDRYRHPVQAGQDGPARGDPAGRTGPGGRRRRGDRRRGPHPRPRARPPAAQRGAGVLRAARRRAARPGRDQRVELAPFGGRVTVTVGEPIPVEGRPTREALDRLTERTWTALHAHGRRSPRGRRAGAVRALADRGLQRLAGGLARGGAGRGDRPPACLAYSRRPSLRQEEPWERPGCRATRRNTGAGSTSRATTRSTRGPPSSCATCRSAAGSGKVVRDFKHAAVARRRRFRTGVRFRRRPAGVDRTRRGGRPDGARRSRSMRSCRASMRQVPDGRERLIEYLVENFEEIVYV